MPDLIDKKGFIEIAERAISAGEAEHAIISLRDSVGGTTRFANNQITQNVHTRRQTLRITLAFGQKHGSAATTDLSEASIRLTAEKARAIAKASPEDPEFLPPLGPQRFPVLASFRPETAAAGPERRARDVGEAIRLCREAGLTGAGIVSNYSAAVGLAASSGLRAYERRTDAQFSVTATGADSSGWASNANRSIDDLGVVQRTRTAIEKARLGAAPRELPAGRYTVILEPAAVLGLVNGITDALDAKSYHKGTSALKGKLGQPVIDARLTLQNRPDHPSLLGDGFNGYGLPTDWHAWIDRGVLRRLSYDRFTAREQGADPSYDLDAMLLSGTEDAPGGSAASPPNALGLLPGVERGILVTNFWYIRMVNPLDLTLTGMTRDGTYLVENGEIAGGVLNFRWHESPLHALNRVEAFTAPLDAISMEQGKSMVPALRIRDFNFSSVTKF